MVDLFFSRVFLTSPTVITLSTYCLEGFRCSIRCELEQNDISARKETMIKRIDTDDVHQETPGNDHKEGELTNPYLEMRQAKIARNQRKLERLGLSQSTTVRQNSTIAKSVNVISASSITLESPVRKKSKVQAPVAVRRSSRRRKVGGQPIPESTNISSADVQEIFEMDENNVVPDTSTLSAKALRPNDPKPGTTRATPINIRQLLYGHFNYPVFVGRQLSNTGKAAVVNHALFMCQLSPIVSFNKYSGVCEWNNDAVFLWVNIGSPDAEVHNEFLESGTLMTWYGGSRMKEESPSIQKLIDVGGKAARGELEDTDGIVLWCRIYQQEKRTFSPYTCLGRLAYMSHDSKSYPIKFLWKLLDRDVLLNARHEGGTTLFEVIKESSEI